MKQEDSNPLQGNPSQVMKLSIPISLLVAGISLIGIFSPDFYVLETANWQAQSIGQDIIDIVLIVPTLLATALLTRKNKNTAMLLWGGVILYILYTFIIYCFDVHFNQLFLAYCLVLGLSFYAGVHFVYKQLKEPLILKIDKTIIRKVIATYFILTSILFFCLWLTNIIPAMVTNTTPKVLLEAGLPTNPVHVLDLAIFLPGVFITGVLLLRNEPAGLLLTPVVLVFFTLMDITIAALSAIMFQRELQGEWMLTIVMSGTALLSLLLLFWFLKNMKYQPTHTS